MSKIERLPGVIIVIGAMFVPLMFTNDPAAIAVAAAGGGMVGGLWIGDVNARNSLSKQEQA